MGHCPITNVQKGRGEAAVVAAATVYDAHTAAANLDSFASNGFKRSSAQSAAERNFLPSSQRTETECVGGWVSQKPDDEIRCPNPLAYSRKKLMAVHALPAASALANSSRGIDGRREPSLEARSTGTDCCRNALCVPKTRFCNIGDEVRRGQAVM